MPELTLVRAAPRDLAKISESYLQQIASSAGLVRVHVVAPSRVVARLLVRRAAERSGAVAGLTSGTIHDLVAAMLPSDPALRRLPDRGGLSIVARMLELNPGPFGARAPHPRLAAALDRTLAELREAGIRKLDLDGLAGETTDQERGLLQHVSDLLEAFSARLEAMGLEDDAARYARASGPASVMPADHVVMHAIYDLNGIQRELIARLARDLPITWIIPDLEDSPSWEILDETIDWATRRGFRQVPTDETDESSRVSFATAAGSASEAAEAARAVLRLCADGADVGEIAIVSADRARGAARHAESLRRAGIPVAGTPPAVLFDVPRARRVFAMSALLAGSARVEDMASLVESKGGLTAARISHLATRAGCEGIDAGSHAGLLTRFARSCVEAARDGGRKETAHRKEAIEARLAAWRIGRLARDAERLRGRFRGAEPDDASSWSDLAEALATIFERLDLDRELTDRLAEASRSLRNMSRAGIPFRYDLALEAFEEWLRTGRTIGAEEGEGAEGGRSRADERKPGEGVLVIDLDRARGLSVEHVLVTGVTHEQVDAAGGEDPLLPERLRGRLRELSGLPLRSSRRRADEADLLIALAIAAGRSSARVSWPRSEDGSGRALVPSDAVQERVEASSAETPIEGIEPGPPRFEDAPERPLLDLAEYDLAVSWDGAAGSSAAHLWSDPVLERVLRAHRARWRSRDVTDHDGLVGTGILESKVRYVPTALERLAECPFKFFLRDHLGLAEPEREDPLGAPDPRDLGSIVHEVLEELYAQLVGKPAASWPEDEQLVRRVAASLRAKLDRKRLGSTGAEPLWDVELRKARSAVARFVLLDKRRMASTGRVVLAVEEALEEAVDLGGAAVDVRGRVDRLDRDSDGGLHVTDYKYSKGSGSPTPSHPLRGGTSLQLPLYAMLVAARYGSDDGSAQIVYLKDGAERETFSTRFDEAAGRRDQIADLIERLARFDAGGQFVQRLDERVCGYCDFESLCGPSKIQRARRKGSSPHRKALEALAEDHP